MADSQWPECNVRGSAGQRIGAVNIGEAGTCALPRGQEAAVPVPYGPIVQPAV